MRNPQLALIKKTASTAYGGKPRTTRASRVRRKLSTKNTVHLILKSTNATGDWSFFKKKNRTIIKTILTKFAKKHGIGLHSLAIVGNHFHVHIKLGNRFTYAPFIRAISGAIVLAITEGKIKGFWDQRPFTRIVYGRRGFKGLQRYVAINQLQSQGIPKDMARIIVVERPPPA